MAHTPSVLFVCAHNAGRSQMAAGFLTTLAEHRIEVRSAGRAPADAIDPLAVAAMAEVGIDITAAEPKALTDEAVGLSDVVVTLGCADACPFFPGISYRNWELPDPAGFGLDGARQVRDRIRILVENLIAELLPAPRH